MTVCLLLSRQKVTPSKYETDLEDPPWGVKRKVEQTVLFATPRARTRTPHRTGDERRNAWEERRVVDFRNSTHFSA